METYSTTSFIDDVNRGKAGEDIFIDDFLRFLRVNYEDVTGRQGFRVIDTDFLARIGTYEIKANYKDNKIIIIEEYTNINPAYGNKSKGWFYKSQADVIVFLSKITRAMILVPFTQEFRIKYESIKGNYELEWNRVSEKGSNRWQSAFRRIPLDSLSGYFAYYKKP